MSRAPQSHNAPIRLAVRPGPEQATEPGIAPLLKVLTPMLLSEVIHTYLDDCYGLSLGTQALYATHLNRFLQAAGDRPIGELGASSVRSFMANLCRRDGQEYSAAYLDQVYRTLNTFFAWVLEEGIIEANPMTRVRRPRVPKRKSPRLTLSEVKQLLNAAKETSQASRNLAIICLMVGSGLRRSEVLRLRLDDVDIESGMIRVHGKGDKDRDVPIEEMTRRALTAYLTIRPASESTVLFLTAKGMPLTRDGLQSLVYRLKKKTGLRRLHCHLLRHTFANHFIGNGESLRKLQKILGHASVETTASIYTDPELPELQLAHSRGSPLAHLN